MVAEVHIVPQGTEPIRLQEYGVGIFDEYPTKSSWKKAIKARKILLNGEEASTARMVQPGDRIESLGVPDMPDIEPTLALEVLFEDEHLAAILKPAGVSVSGNKRHTVANSLPAALDPSAERDACTPRTVHRLDYATSGVLLVGKTRTSIRQLGELFADRKVRKTYYAIVVGTPPQQGMVDSPIGEKPSVSRFELVDSVPSARFTTLSLVRLFPETGRRHQLRIHMAQLGHPILGDRKYSRPGELLRGKGLYLHAFAVEFEHPISGEPLKIVAEPHKKFAKIFPFVPWHS